MVYDEDVHDPRHGQTVRVQHDLGHRSSAITEVYAELDKDKAVKAMLKYG